MKKSEFLQMVQVELDAIRERATDEEKSRLNFDSFSYYTRDACIYGQMTGVCDSTRAREIFSKMFKLAAAYNRTPFSLQFFTQGDGFTPLEKYLFMVATKGGRKSLQHKRLIQYIKGEIDTIKL